jgi:hypothetical protein
MTSFLKTTDTKLKIIIDNYFIRDLKFNNYFGVEFYNFEYFSTAKTLVLRKPFDSFYRVYIMSECESDLLSVLSNLDALHVINIPSRKPIIDWDTVLQKANFKCHAVYERLIKKTTEKRGDFVPCYATIHELNEIDQILNSTFSPITAWLPSKVELISLIEQNKILVSRDDIGVSGLLVFLIENKKVNLKAWANVRGIGLSLLFNVFNLMADIGIQNSYLWTNSENKKAKDIYLIFDFKPDGLMDYTYLKK